ncbi:DNA methyltransferase [Chitinophaga sp. OAE865]|uniref:DNA-methyltransferase n=1 Tax=Chitinophaga sp. OAE865 TaxID=2817898 RepID=UPI001AE37C58
MEPISPDSIIPVDCLVGLKSLPDNYIQCCVTSPPYWRQRDYQVHGQIGMEQSLDDYIEKLMTVFEQVRRVLKPDGVLWLNIGDVYWGSGKGGKKVPFLKKAATILPISVQSGWPTTARHPELKPKDLIGLPWLIAFRLRSQGWYLRQEIIWYKKNGMPESVRDRCTRTHETIFMLSKSSRYHYNHDAIKTPFAEATRRDKRLLKAGAYNRIKNYEGKATGNQLSSDEYKSSGDFPVVGRGSKQDSLGPRHKRFNERWAKRAAEILPGAGANRRSVWVLPFQPYKGNHFATFPPALPEICIKAGSRPGDIILDPFMGAGTTAMVAKSLKRRYIGFELNPDYVRLAEKRIMENCDGYGKK